MDVLTVIQSAVITFLVLVVLGLIKYGVKKADEWTKDVKEKMDDLGKSMVGVVSEIREIRKDFDRVNGRFDSQDAEIRALRSRLHTVESTVNAIVTMLEILEFKACKECALGDVIARFAPGRNGETKEPKAS